MKLYFVFVVLFLGPLVLAKVSYDGYEVWRMNTKQKTQKSTLWKIIESNDLDVWSEGASTVDVMVSPDQLLNLNTLLQKEDLTHRKMIKNVGDLIKEEEQRLTARPYDFSLNDYNTFIEIEEFLSSIVSTNENATLVSIGKTVQQRDIWQIKFSVGENRPSVWIDCNIHAREWIGGATCVYGINYISEGYGTDPDVTALLDSYDVYVLPINNPDGYDYTWTTDRLWRKNRNKYPEDVCYGVDNNRNFDDHFGGAGTSNNSCTQMYHGPSAASEPETEAIQNEMKNLIENADLTVLFSIHSYALLWLYPFGYTTDLPPEVDEMIRVSDIGVRALEQVNGTVYTYGSAAQAFYPAASNTVDYAYAQGVVYAFTLELRDEGEYGFLLPPEQIAPTGAETWAGIIAAVLAV